MDSQAFPEIKTTGAAGFLEWLKLYQPKIYQAVKDKLPKGVAGFGAFSDGAFGDDAATTTTATPSWLDTMGGILTGLGTAYLTKTQVDAQNQLWSIQLQRAQAGLAPLNINPAQYGLAGPSVNLGLTSSTQKLVMYGGAALLAVILLPKLLKGR